MPRVVHPDWLHKKVCEKEDRFRQRKLVDIFNAAKKDEMTQDKKIIEDIEELVTKERARVTPRLVVHGNEINKENYSSKPPSPGSEMLAKLEQQDPSACRLNESLVLPVENGICNETVNKNTDYLAWLEMKKRKWKDNRQERKRRR